MSGQQKDNPFVSLLCNIVIPSLILMKLSSDERLGALTALLVALLFPIGYGCYELIKARRIGFIPALGLINVLLTGGLGLLQVDGFWFAVKEAAVPFIIGIAIVLSLRTRTPLVKVLFYNKSVVDVDKIEKRLLELKTQQQFERLLETVSYMFGGSFLLSAVLNFFLAYFILQSPTGSPAFNEELGKMTALSFPVIVVPCMVVSGIAFWYLLKKVKQLTLLSIEELLVKKH